VIVNLGKFLSKVKERVGIQLVLWVRDGMDMVVLILLVLLIATTMAQSVFVLIQGMLVSHGRSMMVYNVYMYLDHVPKVHHGMVLTVLQRVAARLAITGQEHHVLHYLKNVSPQQNG
jgi:hypothetical protein